MNSFPLQEQSLVEKFRSQGGAQLKEFCQFGTTEECMKTNGTSKPCDKLHFKKIIHKHTDGTRLRLHINFDNTDPFSEIKENDAILFYNVM